VAEAQGQQAALENLYQELARNRDDWVLADAEHSITLAVQQLQLAGNVPAAIVALQAADARLARVDRPHFVVLRKALNRDLERLKALPFVDLSGMSLRLENMVAGVDGLPLLADSRPRPETPAVPATPVANADSGGLLATLARELWQEFRGLLRIQRLDRPDPILLPPEQTFFLRENLKLRLLNARLALFAREQWTFRNDLKQAQQVLERYFDVREKSVQGVQAALKQLVATDIVIDLPNLNETLTAMRNSKASKDAARELGKDSAKGRK
jgi:uroporphyrin-3 C-methyltransferase